MASTQTLQPTNPSAQAPQSNLTSTIKSAGSLLSSTSKLSTSDAIKSLRNVMTNGPPTIAIHWFGYLY